MIHSEILDFFKEKDIPVKVCEGSLINALYLVCNVNDRICSETFALSNEGAFALYSRYKFCMEVSVSESGPKFFTSIAEEKLGFTSKFAKEVIDFLHMDDEDHAIITNLEVILMTPKLALT